MEIRLKDAVLSANTGADAIQRAPIVEYDTGIKCLRIGDISNKRKFEEWGFTNVNEENYKRYRLKKGNIIIARTGSTVGINKFIESDCNSVYNNGLVRLVIDEKKYNSKFIYYTIQMKKFKNYIDGIAFGTTGQPNIQINDILNYKFNDISLEKQNKIVNVLSIIDEKIELNNQINDNLLYLCKYKYDELINSYNNWKLTRLKDLNLEVTDYVANGSFKSLADNVTLYDKNEYALYVRNTDLKVNFTDKRKYVDKKSYEFLKKSKLNGGELIISNVGDVGSVFICPHLDMPMTLGSNVVMLYSTDEHYYNYFLYFFFTSPYGQYMIDGITGGSAQPKFNKTDFRNMEIKFPTLDELDKFNNYIEPIYKKYELNIKVNENLSKARDTLLPKLMNGEINLDKIEL